MQLDWRTCRFSELSGRQVYDLLQLRSAVFVVEQRSIYLDMDNRDVEALHLLGTQGANLLACARLFAPGLVYDEASIGRVVTAQACRRNGMGRELMRRAIREVHESWGPTPIRIGAQRYLQAFYESFGFRRAGEDYLEDGIQHLPMRRPAS